jgi:hypothetical protein
MYLTLSRDADVDITTGNPAFAESRKLSAKANKPSATALPTVALGTGLTENFVLGHGSLPSTRAQGPSAKKSSH